jgi:hypothetical protein
MPMQSTQDKGSRLKVIAELSLVAKAKVKRYNMHLSRILIYQKIVAIALIKQNMEPSTSRWIGCHNNTVVENFSNY